MSIKAIPLSRLEADLHATLNECADSGETVVVELPGQRFVTLQTLGAAGEDSLIDELLQSNPAFASLVARSKAAARKPFVPASQP